MITKPNFAGMRRYASLILLLAAASAAQAQVPAPFLYYNFEEGAGTELTDLSGNDFTGTIERGMTFVAGAPNGPTPSGGGLFNAGLVQVPGINAPADLAHRDSNPNGSYSLSCWLKPDPTSLSGDRFFWGQTSQGIHNGLRNNGRLHTAHWGSDFYANTVLTADVWVHAAWTYDGPTDTAHVYLNGVLDGGPFSQVGPNGSGNLILGGRNGGSQNFNGCIDDVAVWQEVLTPAVIADIAAGAEIIPTVDTDGDGMPDAYEDNHGLDKTIDDSAGDLDSDGLTNLEEYTGRTDPQDDDSDDDGLLDGAEVNTHSTDPRNADSDGDGLSDGDEVNTHGTDPNNSDTDGDGSPDAQEIADGGDPNDPNDAGFFESFSFDTDDGGFTQEATGNSPIPSAHDAVRGTWPMEGDDSGPATNTITSPDITMPTTGGLLILFSHRYSIETEWDGTAIQFSRNGGPFVTVPIGAFTQNGYTFTGLIGNHVLGGEDGFNGVSPGYAAGAFITSVADFGSAAMGDTFQVRFLGAWDEGARGPGLPNWEINSVSFKIKSDTDGDGMPDDYEDATPGLDKNVDDAAGDLDGEGLSNLDEFLNGSDPNLADTDSDGSDDSAEAANGTDPTNPDSDGDGLTDGVETNTGIFNGATDTGSDPNNEDSDGDGFKDFIEVTNGGDPNDANIRPAVTQITSLGTGTGALRGGDLTDPEDDGVEGNVPVDGDWSTLNWNWVSIEASQENYFGNFGGSEGAYDLFDNQVGAGQTKWCCAGPPQWLTVEFEKAVSLDSFTVTSGNDVPGRDPLTWGIYGSNDNVTFEPIFEQDDPISLWTLRLEVIEFKLPRFSKPYKFIKYEVTQTQTNHQINEIEYFGVVNPPSLFLEVVSSGDDLVLTWESGGGELFNLRSETDLSNGEPISWPIFDGHADIVATPPLNTLTIPRPPDSERFFAIEVFPAPPESIFSDDFESGQGGWTFGSDGAAGTAWELGVPTNGPGTANSLVNCFGTNLTSDYGINADVWLRSPAIDLTTAGGATLNYFQYRDIEEGFDFGIISVLDAADDSLIAEIPGIDSGAFAWELVSKSIPAEALGKMIKIEFRMTSDEIETFPGLFIDDFEVTVP